MPEPTEFTIKRVQQRPPYNYERVRLNAATVRDVLEYLFGTTGWKQEPEMLHRRVAHWKQTLYADDAHVHATSVLLESAPDAPPPAMPPADPATPQQYVYEDDPGWLARALVLRVMHGASWPAIAEQVGKPRSTVQRVVKQAIADRNIQTGP